MYEISRAFWNGITEIDRTEIQLGIRSGFVEAPVPSSLSLSLTLAHPRVFPCRSAHTCILDAWIKLRLRVIHENFRTNECQRDFKGYLGSREPSYSHYTNLRFVLTAKVEVKKKSSKNRRSRASLEKLNLLQYQDTRRITVTGCKLLPLHSIHSIRIERVTCYIYVASIHTWCWCIYSERKNLSD